MALHSSPDLARASAPEAAEIARDERYLEAAALYGAPLERMARAYEADPSRRQDLLQDVHVAIWRSLLIFDGRCSLRTWVYRVAHCGLVFVFGAWFSLRKSKGFQREIDALKTLDEDAP